MSQLEEAVDRIAAETGFSGVVRIDRGDRVRLAKAYGLAHRGYQIANTTDTRFAIASGGKGLTALTVVSLIEQGQLDLPRGAEPPVVPTFQVVPRRWVVERSFAWLGQSRRLARDYEFLPATSEAAVYLATRHLLVRRLAGRGPARQHRSVRRPVTGRDPPAARARSSGSRAGAAAPPVAHG